MSPSAAAAIIKHITNSRMVITAVELAEITGGKLTGIPGLEVSELLTDSRQLSRIEGIAFFAIKGNNHDGHRFIQSLAGRGVKVFVVENLPEESDLYNGCSFIAVENTISALQKLAAFRRSRFHGSVIAITGSSGKTIVKEWLADIMSSQRSVIRSPRSYNSQLGVPLSVWKLSDACDTGIFEAGISRMGEMGKLEAVISPDTGVFTNIGDAHSENFKSISEKAAEKLRLFINCSRVIYCSDYDAVREIITSDERFKGKNIVDWSFEDPEACCFVSKSSAHEGKTELEIKSGESVINFTIPFTDRASVENSVTVAVVCLSLGINPEAIRYGLLRLTPVAMRMELKSGIRGCQLIEDYYNSDPGSLKMALEFMRSRGSRNMVLVLSDFVQSGRNETLLYGEIAELLERMEIRKFIGIGEALCRNRSLFRAGSRFYWSTDEFIARFSPADFSDEIILLKGARKFEFERISHLLVQQVHQTVLEINLDAISHNLGEFRKRLNTGTRIMAMVKAFAYGAGPSEIASLLEYHRIDYLAVAIADEGAELRNAGVSVPVVVMNPDPAAFSLMIKHSLEPEIYSLPLLREFTRTASRFGLTEYPVHIKLDTGMHRLGFMPGEIEELIIELRKTNCLKVASVFSHLSAAGDEAFDSFTHSQAGKLLLASETIRRALEYDFLLHILNTAGICRFPEYQFDMIRPGIGLYGISSCRDLKLKQAGRYTTRILQVKKVSAGEPVGYGCRDVSAGERVIAILPVGYADGLDRKLGNGNGRLFIGGKHVPIIGNICMDMCMADITGADAGEGDEAEIFGSNISVEEVAEKCGTIPYEILTSIPERVKRVFYRE
jgi:alanine racemase